MTDDFEDVGPELVRLYDPIPPDIAEINEIAERLRAKTFGSASVLSIEVGEDGSLAILASGSEGYINLAVEPGECAHILGWSMEEIKHFIKYSLVWID